MYGPTDFDLAGTGFYIVLITQMVLVLLLGLSLAFISYILPPHASSATKLSITRLKTAWDTIYGTGILLYLVIQITTYVRIRQPGGIGAYEFGFMGDISWLQYIFAAFSWVSFVTYRHPAGIKRPSRPGWGIASSWFTSFGLMIIGEQIVNKKKYMPKSVLTHLCTSLGDEESSYPFISSSSTPQTSILLLLLIYGSFAVVAVALAYFASTIYNWLKNFLTSKAFMIFWLVSWVTLLLCGLGMYSWHLHYLRQGMFRKAAPDQLPQWSFGQILLLAMWCPAIYRLVLTLAVCLDTHFTVRDTAPEGSIRRPPIILMTTIWILCKQLRPDFPFSGMTWQANDA